MKESRKIVITLIFIISAIVCSNLSLVFAKTNYNSEIYTKNNYIQNNKLTYRKEEDGKTLISGFKIGEKVGEILNDQFGEEYTVKIKNNQGVDITNQINTKIGTGNKIELYSNGNLEKIYTIVIYGDTNGDSNIGAVDALAIIKNKLETEQFKSDEYEEAGRVKIETRQEGIVPKSDDALYIIKYKLYPAQYPIDQKMIGTDQEEKIENGDNTEGTTNGTITGGDYNHNNPVIPSGFETVDTEDTNWDSTDGETVDDWNKGLVIQDKQGNQFVWVPVDKTNIEYKKWLSETNDESIKDLLNLKEDILPNRVTNEKEQIEKYGGFYISRYEAGIPQNMTEAINTASADTRNVVGIPISKKEQIAWNYINYNTAKTNAEKMYRTNNVQSGLPTGTQWDILIKWLKNIGENKLVESTLKEWTSEEYNNYKIVRGEDNGLYPSLYRGKLLPSETNDNIGFRCVLYIQETKLPEQTEKNITITFNANGGNVNPSSKIVTYNGTYGELPTPIKENYTFTGWFTQETGGTQVTNSTIVDLISNHTLYAHWIANTYKVTYNLNGGDAVGGFKYDHIVERGNSILLPSNHVYRQSYRLMGWSEDANASTATYEAGKTITPTYDMTLYAIWKENVIIENTYIVTYNVNGGDALTPTSKAVTYNSTYGDLPTPTRVGYTFTGWYTDINNGTQITKDTQVTITEDQTLYAHWTVNNYTLTVKHYLENANDAGYTYQTGKDTTENISYGTTITLANKITTIANGTYHHGTTAENGATVTTITMNTNTTIYLYYSRNKYTLTLNKGSDIATVTGNGDYKVGQNVIINATLVTSETGYTINWSGWTSSNTSLLANNSTQNATIQMPAGNVTLTANATKTANTYTVTYNVNGGNTLTPENKTVTYNSTYGELPAPVKAGNTFGGWYTQPSGGTKIESTTKVTITADQTIYAHWTVNNYTLTVKHYLENANDTGYTYQTGKDTTENISYGTTITLADKKTTIINGTYKEGRLAENGSATTTTTMGASNKTIYLYYSRNKYTLTLNRGTNIATVTGDGEYKVGQNVTINATLGTETGYTITWSGWTSNNTNLIANNSTQNTTIQMPAGNVTLTANATKTLQKYTITYNANGGSGTPENQFKTHGTDLTLSTIKPTREGYAFLGWATSNIATVAEYTSGSIYTTNANIKLYAVWKANAAPVLASPSVYSRNTNDITIRSMATDTDGDKLTYKLYLKTTNGTYPTTPNATSNETTQGSYVNLQATGLSTYTVYNYKVEVTDGYTTIISTEGTTGTGCDGTGHTCSEGHTSYCSNTTLSTCVGKMVSTRYIGDLKCSYCGVGSVLYNEFICNKCGRIEYEDYCGNPRCEHWADNCLNFDMTGDTEYVWLKTACNKETYSCSQHGYSGESDSHVLSQTYCTAHHIARTHTYCDHGKTSMHYPN